MKGLKLSDMSTETISSISYTPYSMLKSRVYLILKALNHSFPLFVVISWVIDSFVTGESYGSSEKKMFSPSTVNDC